MKRSEPLRLDQVIQRMIDATGMRPDFGRHSIEAMWPVVVGRHIAAYTTQAYVRERTLHVHITSASLKEELGYARAQLVDNLNNAVGEDIIDDIIIH
ncbi:MAG: DUF721 domain-containing protein [Muribaculaceae bacterium]|nr:DUF721 domain-containing protein [Muribaculaceae bacterium]